MVSLSVHLDTGLGPPAIGLVPLPVGEVHVRLVTPGEVGGALHVPEPYPHGVIMLEVVLGSQGHEEGLLDGGVDRGEVCVVHPGDGQGSAGGEGCGPVSPVCLQDPEHFKAPTLELQPVLGAKEMYKGESKVNQPSFV